VNTSANKSSRLPNMTLALPVKGLIRGLLKKGGRYSRVPVVGESIALGPYPDSKDREEAELRVTDVIWTRSGAALLVLEQVEKADQQMYKKLGFKPDKGQYG
jgi:hypothetical protein